MPNEIDYTKDVNPLLRAAMDRLENPQAVYKIFRSAVVREQMEKLARSDIPPVLAAESELLTLGKWVHQDDAKRVFGRIAKFIMTEELGYEQCRSSVRTPNSALFTKGTTYALPLSPLPVGGTHKVEEGESDIMALSNELLRLAAMKFAAITKGEISPTDFESLQMAIQVLR